MPFKLTWLPTVLKNAGLKVAEEEGWPNRGRGNLGTVKGVMCHHTAGPLRENMPSLRTLRDGRSDLPGPLSQLGLGRDGTFYVIAAGRANHAGGGNWQGLTTGNSSFIGIEAENNGRVRKDNNGRTLRDEEGNEVLIEPWPEEQLDAYRRGVAAILSHIDQDAIMCCGHKEYATPAGRKTDPRGIDMDQFRADVARIMGDTPPPLLIDVADRDGRPTLRRASSTNPKFLVKEVQRKVGFSGSQVDGIFGPLTEAAVRRFQRENGLVPDGIVGPLTWRAVLGNA